MTNQKKINYSKRSRYIKTKKDPNTPSTTVTYVQVENIYKTYIKRTSIILTLKKVNQTTQTR